VLLSLAALAVAASTFSALSVAGAAAAAAVVVLLLVLVLVPALTGAFRASAKDFLRPHTLPAPAAVSLFSSTTAAATALPCALSDCGEPLLAAPVVEAAELDLGDVAAVDSPVSVTAAFLGLLPLLCLVGDRGEAALLLVVVLVLLAVVGAEELSAGGVLSFLGERTGDLPRGVGDVCCAAGASAACGAVTCNGTFTVQSR
jgi:hypothetical protein